MRDAAALEVVGSSMRREKEDEEEEYRSTCSDFFVKNDSILALRGQRCANTGWWLLTRRSLA